MGCSPGDTECDPDENPRHRVTISKGFWLGQTPVTVGAYKKFVDSTGGRMPKAPKFNANWTDLEMPMVDVTWDQTQPYCKWIGGRLPTEAEWEYAARAGNTAPRYGPLDEVAWYADNSGRERIDSAKIWKEERNRYLGKLFANGDKPHDVGQKKPNAFGLYDMLGNVYQYTNDWYGGTYYSSSPAVDPTGPKEPDVMQYQVLRGGSWVDHPVRVRVSYRDGRGQGFQIGIDGFRTVWEEAGP
jgi:formylglycine-generating enzyme required for sulfatase activity